MKRVVITGVGVIAANGLDTDTFWDNCLKDHAVVDPIPEHWTRYADYKSKIWAPLPSLDFTKFGFNRMEIMQRDPVTLLMTAAAEQAIKHANIETKLLDKRKNNHALCGIDAERTGVFIGTGSGGYTSLLQNHAHHTITEPGKRLQQAHPDNEDIAQHLQQYALSKRFNPFGVPMAMVNAVSASVGIKFSLHGPNRTVAQACASGTLAIGHAYEAISNGVVDMAITGGCEYVSDADGGEFRGFDIAKTLARDCDPIDSANRPFDEERSGFLFAQGGAAGLVLETLEHAQNRGAPILAELVNFSETFDADSLLSLDPNGAQITRMLTQLLAKPDVNPEQIDYINAHGTGTGPNDRIESQLIETIFPHGPLVNSTKSLIGHSFGASGAIEAVVSILSLRDQTTHICHNLKKPIAPLNFVTQQTSQSLNYAISESFAFGGHNVGLLFQCHP
ncbi:MAG: beta-ketoacyl-[acyl-carrier-protein] synthase family protein [Methylococcales bacterium]|jgi:3-oxoacyl-[acyl-carrier-protein] synthase II|nr:beta-ketoacyl-[acyl-carrier-protein] synthase family protein [Methylococcales bacterium]MBT7445298.1 beta-ketoacyl-[acyl-carrier-protein] synthase family protein [Methylococcales bacterium]